MHGFLTYLLCKLGFVATFVGRVVVVVAWVVVVVVFVGEFVVVVVWFVVVVVFVAAVVAAVLVVVVGFEYLFGVVVVAIGWLEKPTAEIICKKLIIKKIVLI